MHESKYKEPIHNTNGNRKSKSDHSSWWLYSDSSLYFRKSENKTRSDTFDTFDVNGAIVEFYNPVHHRKAETGTAIFSGTAFVYAIETLPDFVQVFHTYSNTIIFHFTDNLVIFDLQDNMNMSICFCLL